MLDAQIRPDRDTTRRLGFAWTWGILAFAGFVGLLVVLERIGLPAGIIRPLFVVAIVVVSVASGIAARTMLLDDFDRAGRAMPQAANALAIAAVMAGLAAAAGHGGLPAILAVAATFLSSVLFALPLRRSGAATVAEWIGRRHGGFARSVAAIIVVATCLPALSPLLRSGGAVLATLLPVQPATAVVLMSVVIILVTIFGGLGGISGAQMGQGTVLVAAMLVAAVPFVASATGLGFSGAEAAAERFAAGPIVQNDPYLGILAPLAGAMVLPPVLMRFVAVVTPLQARRSGIWAAVLLAGFAALEAGGHFRAVGGGVFPSDVATSLVAAGLFAAMLAAATGFVFAIANTLSNDLHRRSGGIRMSASRKLIMARLFVVAIMAGAAMATNHAAAIGLPTDPARLIATTLVLALAGLAPVLIVGTIAPHVGAAAASSGMIAGCGAALALLVGLRHPDLPPVPDEAAGLAGAALGFAAMIVVGVSAWILRRSRRLFNPPPRRAR